MSRTVEQAPQAVMHRHREAISHVALAFAIDRNVDCQDQGGVAGVHGAQDQLLGQLSMDNVELEPQIAVSVLRNFLD